MRSGWHIYPLLENASVAKIQTVSGSWLYSNHSQHDSNEIYKNDSGAVGDYGVTADVFYLL